MQDGDGDLSLGALFVEPPSPPIPDPTFSIYTRDGSTGPDIAIRLVGSHPLWGHHLWNAAIAFASYLDSHNELVNGRFVLELGAGGGLPGIVAVQNGATNVVLTDYPDSVLIENLEYNVRENVRDEQMRGRVTTQGYMWAKPVDDLIHALPRDREPWRGFDLIILSDLIFNHSQHDALLRSCELCLTPISDGLAERDTAEAASTTSLKPPPCILVFYTHHRPHLAHRDLEFFTAARQRGWSCQDIYTKKFPPMFPEDTGDVEVRSTVHGWIMTRA